MAIGCSGHKKSVHCFSTFQLLWIMLLWILAYKAFEKLGVGRSLGVELLGHMARLYSEFKKLPHCFPSWVYHFISPPVFPHCHQHSVWLVFKYSQEVIRWQWKNGISVNLIFKGMVLLVSLSYKIALKFKEMGISGQVLYLVKLLMVIVCRKVF